MSVIIVIGYIPTTAISYSVVAFFCFIIIVTRWWVNHFILRLHIIAQLLCALTYREYKLLDLKNILRLEDFKEN